VFECVAASFRNNKKHSDLHFSSQRALRNEIAIQSFAIENIFQLYFGSGICYNKK